MTDGRTPARRGGETITKTGEPSALRDAETWIFDLDNTLYPARCNLFDQVDQRMGQFISERLGLPFDDARGLQKKYFREYGTTLTGLIAQHDVDPHAFLEFVHDIDYAPIQPDSQLAAALERLPGRKLIYTNGTVAHAESVVGRLGVAHHFDVIFDIHAANFVPKPKPAPYRVMVEAHAIRPEGAVMVEDIAKNLLAPAEMGMRTVWVRTEHAWSGPGERDAGGPPDDHIHHVTDDLTAFLHAVLEDPPAAPADGSS